MKRGASKRMMLLIAGWGGVILLLVTLGYMLANHREGNRSENCPPCPACPATAAIKATKATTATTATTAKELDVTDPKIVLLIQDLQLWTMWHDERTKEKTNSEFITGAAKRYDPLGQSGNCPKLSYLLRYITTKLNYTYDKMTICNVIKPNEYNGQGTAKNKTTGEIIKITKEMLVSAVKMAKNKIQEDMD